MTHGILYGIGVGPGDPELLTLKAVNLLRRSRHVFAPCPAPGSNSVALEIAGRHIQEDAAIEEIEFPMVVDRALLQRRWDTAAKKVCDVLEKGEDACFVTLGDPLLYSTYIYLLRAVRRRLPSAMAETVPGVTAFSAVSALTDFPVGEGKTPIRIVPTANDLSQVKKALSDGGTTILMKIGNRLGAILELLTEADLLGKSVWVARAGLPGQRIETDLRKLRLEGNEEGYLSVILVNSKWSGAI